MTLTHSQTTHRGNHREQNEDSCENKETRNGHLFVTCDGMGGAAEGKKASSIGVKSVLEFFERETYENIQIALYQSLKFANEQIYATAQLNPSFKGMGTTACLALFQKDEMYFAHVGDSRIYLQTDDKLKHLTRDHSFVNQLVDQGTLKPNEARAHPEKNRILKALGVHLDLEPTVSNQPVLLKKGDVVLLCSDGLTDMVSDTAIQTVLNEEKTIAEKTELLLQKALDNGGKDNITVQLIEITESLHSKTVFADKTPKDLATTLTGEETINRKKYRFSKKHLAVLLPVLVLLVWGVGSLFNYENKAEIKNSSSEKVVDLNTPNTETPKVINPFSDSTGNNDEDLEQDESKRDKYKNQKRSDKGEADEKDGNTKDTKEMPDYVIINATAADIPNNIYPSITSIAKVFNITEQQIFEINKTNPEDYKAGNKVFLSQEAYNRAYNVGFSNDSGKLKIERSPIQGDETEQLRKWTIKHDSLRVTGELNEDKGTIVKAYQASTVSGKNIDYLLKVNGNISQDDFNKLKVIYITEAAFKKSIKKNQ